MWPVCVPESLLPPASVPTQAAEYRHKTQKILKGSSLQLTGAAIMQDLLFNSFLVKRSGSFPEVRVSCVIHKTILQAAPHQSWMSVHHVVPTRLRDDRVGMGRWVSPNTTDA